MNKESDDSRWADEWNELVTDLNDTMEDEKAMVKESAFSSSNTNPHLAAKGKSVANAFLRQIRESIRYEGATGSASQSVFVSSAPASQAKVEVSKGDIIQLDPSLDPSWCRPVYVLIMDQTDEKITIIPFGPLSLPATDTELATNLGERGLDVLCVWNVSKIERKHLQRHFAIAHADDEFISEVESLLEAIRSKSPAPEPLQARVGPSRFGVGEAKQDYLDHEEGLLAGISTD